MSKRETICIKDHDFTIANQGETRRDRALSGLAGLMTGITKTLRYMKEHNGFGKGRLKKQIKVVKEIEIKYK